METRLLPYHGFNKRFSSGCEEGLCVHIGAKSLIKCKGVSPWTCLVAGSRGLLMLLEAFKT